MPEAESTSTPAVVPAKPAAPAAPTKEELVAAYKASRANDHGPRTGGGAPPAPPAGLAVKEEATPLYGSPQASQERAAKEAAAKDLAKDPAKMAESKPDTEPSLAEKIKATAVENRRARELREKEAAFEAKEKAREKEIAELKAAADAWKDFESAKKTGSRIDRLRKAGFDDAEISDALYWELTEHVAKTVADVTPEQQVEKLVRDAIEAEKKKNEDAQLKAKQDDEAKYEKLANQAYSDTAESFVGSPDKWPLVAKHGVEKDEVIKYMTESFLESGQTKTLFGAELLDYIEKRLGQKHAPKVDETKPPVKVSTQTTVTNEWNRDGGTPDPEYKSRAEKREAIYRKHLAKLAP